MANDQGELRFSVQGTHESAARQAAKDLIRTNYPSIQGHYFDLRLTKSPVSGRYAVRVKYNRTRMGREGQ